MFNTKLEKKMKEILTNLGLEINKDWFFQKKVGKYLFDFYIVKNNLNLLLETDGFLWHTKEKDVKRDMEKETFAKEKGYSIVRFSDNQVYKETEIVIKELKKIIFG